MKIVDLLKRESVELNGKVTSKPEAIEKMVALMAAGGNLADVEAYKKGVFAREEESTTGIGEGIAIPHCKSAAVNQAGLAAMVVPKGVEFDSLDGLAVQIVDCLKHPFRRFPGKSENCVNDDLKITRMQIFYCSFKSREWITSSDIGSSIGMDLLKSQFYTYRFDSVQF